MIFIAYVTFRLKNVIFIVLPSIETVHDTVQYKICIFSLLYRLFRIRLKHQNPLPLLVLERQRERDKSTLEMCKCSVQLTLLLL